MLFELDAYRRLTKSYLVLSAPVAAPGRPIFVGEMAVGRVASASENFLAFCGTSASVAENFLAFAELPQVSRRTFWCLREFRKRLGECREPRAACANVSANAGNLAQPAQTSRQMPGASRGLRKRLGKCRGTCAACANVSVNAGSLAQPAQTSRQMPGYLRGLRKRLGECREPRKRRGELFGVCGTSASVSKGTLAVTTCR